jgi:hypothetical protein
MKGIVTAARAKPEASLLCFLQGIASGFFDLMQGCLWVNQDGINRINNNAGFNNVLFS